jgi:hypothetical protein
MVDKYRSLEGADEKIHPFGVATSKLTKNTLAAILNQVLTSLVPFYNKSKTRPILCIFYNLVFQLNN